MTTKASNVLGRGLSGSFRGSKMDMNKTAHFTPRPLQMDTSKTTKNCSPVL